MDCTVPNTLRSVWSGCRYWTPRSIAYSRPMKASLHIGRKRLEQHLLRVHELLAARVGQLVLRAKHDRLDRAGVLAVAAEDAAQHVDLVRLRVALAGRHAVLVAVLGRDNEDAAHRAGRGAE